MLQFDKKRYFLLKIAQKVLLPQSYKENEKKTLFFAMTSDLKVKEKLQRRQVSVNSKFKDSFFLCFDEIKMKYFVAFDVNSNFLLELTHNYFYLNL